MTQQVKSQEIVAEVLQSLGNGAGRADLVPREPKAPGIIQRVLDPEANRHYRIQQANRHVTTEADDAMVAIGYVVQRAVAVKLGTLAAVEGLIIAHSPSALASAYAPSIAAQAVEVLDGAINSAMSGHAAYVSTTVNRRRS